MTAIVIQCASEKSGGYFRASNGDKVGFLAQPRLAALQPGWIFARPDDLGATGGTWRAALYAYNDRYARTGENPDNLKPAWQLYTNPVYRSLAKAFGTDNLYILSAGWGLVHSDYLLPNYDITFLNNRNVDPAAVRRKDALFQDSVQMLDDIDGPVLFIGGLSYVPLFCDLTKGVRAERILYYNSNKQPSAPGCQLIRYNTNTRTNWHYECARDLASGRIVVHRACARVLSGMQDLARTPIENHELSANQPQAKTVETKMTNTATTLTAFDGKKYLNLETYRRTSRAVRTPLWFAAAPPGTGLPRLYVYSTADSGKAKRIRHTPAVKIAPCDMRGNPTGPWIDARAEIVTGEEYGDAMRLLNHKYRPWKQLLNLFARLSSGHERIVFAIRPV
jgi:PPOX class probable F420-dependent enzyme